jgi:hypothetical protein
MPWWLLLLVLCACEPGAQSGGGPGRQPEPQPQPVTGPAAGAAPAAAPGFLGEPDAALLERLARGPLARVKKGSGGRSLAFKLTLADGTEGYFKPEQSFSGTIWFAEVVAHRLDRALSIGHVPPVVARRLPWSSLAAAAGDDERIPEVTIGGDGQVRGALIAWLSQPLVPARTPPGWENWIRVEPFPPYGVTPFQRASQHGVALREVRERAEQGLGAARYYERAPDADRPDRAAELSDMLVLDFLTNNIDRWGGGNGNVLTLGAGGPLVMLDNSAGFSRGPHRRSLMDGRFFPCQRFRKRTIDALERFDVAAFGAALARDPLGPFLDAYLLAGLAERRTAVLAHVADLRARFGDAATLAF